MLLIDTNIVSVLFKKDSRADLYAPWLREQELTISFVTAAELYKWPLERNWGGERRAALDRFVHSFTVLPYDDALARAWAGLMANARKRGCAFGHGDAWIAATGVRHNLVFVTHNPRHFAGIEGLIVWSKAPGHE